ncbi:retrovirus-related Pol polyprotein from transposon opus [Trichonephila clavipes]|nr:retrovirus-related Pol polyprotein from transposon opus [Trichonephila clavipes]
MIYAPKSKDSFYLKIDIQGYWLPDRQTFRVCRGYGDDLESHREAATDNQAMRSLTEGTGVSYTKIFMNPRRSSCTIGSAIWQASEMATTTYSPLSKGYVKKVWKKQRDNILTVRNRCLHLATGQTRDEIEGRIWQRQETATHIGVLQGEEWYKPRDLGKQCDIFYASKGKSYDEPERAKWNDSENRSFNGSGGKQPFGEKKSDNFSSRKNFDKGQVTEIKKFACFTCGSDKHFKRDCPKNKEVDNKRLNVNKVSTEGTELEDGTVTATVDLLGKVIPRGASEDKLSKLVKTSISVDGKLVHALVDSGTEITVIKKDLVPGISVEGASTIYLKGIFGPAVKCPLVYVPIGLATGGQVNVVHQQVLCALAEVLVEDVLLPPEVLDMLGGAQSEENSLAQSSQDLRVDSGNVDETEVSSGILPEKAQEHIEDSQRNITSCRNEVGTLGTKDEEVTAEMDKGIMVADSFRSEQEGCAELALVWKHAKEGKGNYYEVDGYLFHRDKILGESIGQLVIPKCRRTEVLRLAHTSVFSSHMGPKKTLERIKYSLFWEGLSSNVKKFCESCKECQLTRSVRIKDRSSSTPVARPELPFEVGNMDLIGPIDPPSLKGHKYILCLVDQHTRWDEAVPLTSLSAKVTCEAWLNIFSRTEIYLLSKREGFVEKNSAASWVTVLDLWK